MSYSCRESNIHFLVKSLNYLLITTENYRIQSTFAMQRGEENEKNPMNRIRTESR